MPTIPNASAAYKRRHQILAGQLREVKASATTKQVELALFVSGVVAASLLDLLRLVERSSDELKRELDLHNEQAQGAVTRFQDVVSDVTSAEGDVEVNMGIFLAAIARMQVQTSWNAIDFAVLKCRLIETMAMMWLELMVSLFESDDRRVFFARVEKLIEYASSKLPVVGDVLEFMKTAAELHAIRKKEARDADAYLLSLESYVDAANVYLTGVMAFCESAERTLVGAPQPGEAEIRQRIADHISRVSSGTHPTSRARAG